jgi:hypothetical protein
MTALIDWIATVLAICTSTWRAFNFGYASEVYVVSAVAYLPFAYRAFEREDVPQLILNVFYIATALIGAYRWRPVAAKTGRKRA